MLIKNQQLFEFIMNIIEVFLKAYLCINLKVHYRNEKSMYQFILKKIENDLHDHIFLKNV